MSQVIISFKANFLSIEHISPIHPLPILLNHLWHLKIRFDLQY